MKLPRNARIFQGQLDVAPFAGVFFLLLMFVLFGSSLVYTPGVKIALPDVPDALPGTTNPREVVAVDASGRLYYQGQVTTEEKLKKDLESWLSTVEGPATLVIHADRAVRYEQVVRVMNLAGQAGVPEILAATRPVDFFQRREEMIQGEQAGESE